jgi:hypothetical protein
LGEFFDVEFVVAGMVSDEKGETGKGD